MNVKGRVKEDGAFKFYERESSRRGMSYHAVRDHLGSCFGRFWGSFGVGDHFRSRTRLIICNAFFAGGRGVVPYIGCIGMCGVKGYGFLAFLV